MKAILTIILLLLLPLVLMYAWNNTLPYISHNYIPELDYFKALLLVIVTRILF